MLLLSPRYLFLVPGLLLGLASLVTFLLAAAQATRENGASVRIEPDECPLSELLRSQGLYEQVVGPAGAQFAGSVPGARAGPAS